MKKKIMSVLEIGLACIVGLYAFYGMLCFLKEMAEKSTDSSKTEEIPYNINYHKYNINDRGKDFLVISGNGTVSKEIIDTFEAVGAIYVCESISGIEPNAFRSHEELELVVMPYAICSDDIIFPMQTDVLFIEDNEYQGYIERYLRSQKTTDFLTDPWFL